MFPAAAAEPLRSGQSISLLLRQKAQLNLLQVRQIQGHLFRRCLHQDAVLITQLISSCFSAGATDYAIRLFRSVPYPDLVLCNSMLKGYTLNASPELAALFFMGEILEGGLLPDQYTFPYVLKACAAMKDSELGKQVHGSSVKTVGAGDDIFVLNSLLDMYWKCEIKDLARTVFARISDPDTATFNIMISGLLSAGDLSFARELFDGMPQRDVVSWNTLMSARAKAGDMVRARKLFDEMPKRNLASWNALISGYVQNRQFKEAISVFSEMLCLKVEPDSTTMSSVLSAAGGIDIQEDDRVFSLIIAISRSMKSVLVTTALLSLYARTGRLDDALKLFEENPDKDLVTWNAMIGAYAQNQRPGEAIKLFKLMIKKDRLKPDEITMVSLLDACSQTGALYLGKWIHAFIKNSSINLDVFLYTALVDMYAKCGDLNKAGEVFDEMPHRDLASWNAMISGLAAHGKAEKALQALELMERDGISPNEITYIGLLSACSHSGLVTEGLELFDRMHKKHRLMPRIEHYGCIVDLLSRAGRLLEARDLIRRMPVDPDAAIWAALLSASVFRKNILLAEEAASEIAKLDPQRDGNYVLLSNAYASAGQWETVEKIRSKMRTNLIQKSPGWSSVEIAGDVHCFRSGDRTHVQTTARSSPIIAS